MPYSYRRINWADYSGSGYDRGHLIPSADRFADPIANEETFLMTNIVPQEGDLNRFPWERLESYVRSQVRKGNVAYQIAGVYGENGRLRRAVVVPTNCWKIVVILPVGSPVTDINETTRIIAVDMPNIEGVSRDRWQKYLTNVRAVEQKTGYNFLSNIPADLQDALENKIDN